MSQPYQQLPAPWRGSSRIWWSYRGVLATARTYLAAIAPKYRLDGQPDPSQQPLIWSTMKRVGRDLGVPGGRLPRSPPRPWPQCGPLPGFSGNTTTKGVGGSEKRRPSAAPWWTWFSSKLCGTPYLAVRRQRRSAGTTWSSTPIARGGSAWPGPRL